jgi:hypothetical protein
VGQAVSPALPLLGTAKAPFEFTRSSDILTRMMTRLVSVLVLLCTVLLAADETRFYFVDVGHGNAAFVIAPVR